MLAHYLAITLQSLRRQPVLSAIKILSLTIGLICSLLVLMHIQYIYSYDKHIANWENSYRLVVDLNADPVIHTDISADPYAAQLALDFPEIELIARMQPASATFSRNDDPLVNGFHWADPDLVRIFSLEFRAGDATTALAQPNSVILNETTARKYFGSDSALGQTLTLDNRLDLNVTGIFRDMPENTHVDFQILIAVETGRALYGENFMAGSDWMGFGATRTYLTLPDAASAVQLEADLPDFVARNFPTAQYEMARNRQLVLSLEPFSDLYLSPRRGLNAGVGTNAAAVSFLSMIALVVLVTSCVNFANLAISQMQQRSKELGVKKALGVRRGQIIAQLLFESLAQALLALLLALPIVILLAPYYTAIIGEAIGVDFTPAILLDAGNAVHVLLFVVATGVLSGLVPALVLSRQRPALILRSGAGALRSRLVRPLITVLQFTFSAGIVMVAVASYRQMDFMFNLDLGFDMENLVIIDTGYDARNPDRFNHEVLKNELAQHAGVRALGSADAAPPAKGADGPWRLESFAEGDVRLVRHYTVDADFIDTMGFRLLAGRSFDADFATDFTPPATPGSAPTLPQGVRSIVITRNALHNFGLPSAEGALGKMLFLDGNGYRVIGVIDDYYVNGAVVGSTPLANVLRASTAPLRYIMLQVDPARMRDVQEHIGMVWRRHRHDTPLAQTVYSNRYRFIVGSWETPIMSTTVFASVITVIIALCGLYALALYATRRRIKEVGVRKVFGATTGSLVTLLTWSFIRPVLVACALASVAAWFAIQWVYGLFLFSPDVPVWVYLGVALATLAVAAGTVAALCFRAASANPVRSLRYE